MKLKSRIVRRVLENLVDRACQKKQIPSNMGLSNFVDWLRGLYPELYAILNKHEEEMNKQFEIT